MQEYTHMQFIRRCDKVAILDHGKFQYFGPFNAIAQNILSKYLPVPEEDTTSHGQTKERAAVTKRSKPSLAKPEAKIKTSLSLGAGAWRLLNAGPAWKCILALLFGMLSQSTRQMSDFWIRFWSKDTYKFYDGAETHGEYASKMYAGVYGALTFAFFCIQLLRTGGFFLWGKAAADRMMKRSLHRVLNTPMGFFLAKPVGELLSTFSSDQDKIDEALPDALHLACAASFPADSFLVFITRVNAFP
jgi:ATP-binding cassette, subfamily C (CFTR/MRP), member 1